MVLIDAEELEVAVRAWAIPDYLRHTQPPAGTTNQPRAPWVDPGPSDWCLIFDTETTRDPAQRLRLGTFQLRKKGRLRTAGIFYDPDVLTPAEVETVHEVAGRTGVKVLSAEQFREDVFLRVAWDRRGLIVGHNLPFDIARIAIDHVPTQSRDRSMRGGFTFRFSENPKRSHVQVKRVGPGAAFMRVTIPAGISPEKRNRDRGGRTPNHHGYFVDTATLGGALLGGRPSLAKLADLLGTEHRKSEAEHGETITPEYLDYAFNDTQVTWECCQQLNARYASYRLSKGSWGIFSEASVGKAHLDQMELAPVRKLPGNEMPDWLTAALMESYYGGRAECMIRRTPVPGVLVDFTSQYPTVFSLMGLWPFMTAERIDWGPVPPEEIQQLLDTVTVDEVLDQALWPQLSVLVLVEPDGDRLPTRARYKPSTRGRRGGAKGSLNVALPYRTGGPAQHWTLADCIASKLATGEAPNILAAWRFAAHGTQPELQPIDVAGDPNYRVDPAREDFIKRLVEMRADVKTQMKAAKRRREHETIARLDAIQQGMKITANSVAYGTSIEMNPIEHRKPVWVTIHQPDGSSYRARVPRTEQPGKWFQPLIATLVTSGGRLLLATAMHLLDEHGGHYAFCDTDSLFIAATAVGGPVACRGGTHLTAQGEPAIRVLSWEDVNAIVARFEALNPYDRSVIPGSVLKIEDENYDPATGEQRQIECYAIAAKRYALVRRTPDGQPIVISDHRRRRRSEHGLGHLLPPYARRPDTEDPDWLDEWWQHLLNVELDFPTTAPVWFGLPAVGRLTVNSPRDEGPFDTYNESRPYPERVRPGNFLMLAHVAPQPERKTPKCLLAAYEQDAARRLTAPWIDRDSPESKPHAITAGKTTARRPGATAVLTYSDYFDGYRQHPETKAADQADGRPCHTWTSGLLRPRHLQAAGLQPVGKESNRLTDTPQPEGTDENALIEYPAQRTCRGCDAAVSGRRRWCGEPCRKRTGRRVSAGAVPTASSILERCF